MLHPSKNEDEEAHFYELQLFPFLPPFSNMRKTSKAILLVLGVALTPGPVNSFMRALPDISPSAHRLCKWLLASLIVLRKL